MNRYPTRFDLDEVVDHRPVFLWRACWHIGVANSEAMRRANIDLTHDTFEVAGGVVDVENRVPTGIFRESAVKLIIDAVANKTPDQIELLLKEGLRQCTRLGLTAVQTNDEGSYSAYTSLVSKQRQYEASGLTLPDDAPPMPSRVFLTPMADEVLKSSTIAPFRPEGLQVAGCVANAGSKLVVERVKFFTDGSLGAETAAIKVPIL